MSAVDGDHGHRHAGVTLTHLLEAGPDASQDLGRRAVRLDAAVEVLGRQRLKIISAGGAPYRQIRPLDAII